MNTYMNTCRLLSVSAVAGALVLSALGKSDDQKIYVNIVGEVFAPASTYVAPTSSDPAYYVLYDAGFVERGDPIANDDPPPAADVTRALGQYLPAANFLPATAAHPPSLLLVSHWGVMREDSIEISPPYEIKKSLRARIRLVATPEIARRIERDLVDRIYQRGFHQAPWPRMLSNLEQDTLDIARDDHYFVIVTAYDYAAAAQKRIVPVWRVKFSTYTRRTGMPDALPALIRNGRTYFGRVTAEPVNEKMRLYPETEVKLGELQILGEAPPAPSGSEISADILETLRKDESSSLGGAKVDPAAAAAKPAIPAALNERIESYRARKQALQDELKAALDRVAPGPDTTRQVDAFNRRQAGRIDTLNRELAAIRSELAQLAAADAKSGGGKSIQALIDEFATANY